MMVFRTDSYFRLFQSQTCQHKIYSSLFSLLFSLRPGSVIVYFVLYFKTAVTPEKGLENLKIVISTNGTFGRYKARDLFSLSDKSTTSTTPTGINDVRILSIHPLSIYSLFLACMSVSSRLFLYCLRAFFPINFFFLHRLSRQLFTKKYPARGCIFLTQQSLKSPPQGRFAPFSSESVQKLLHVNFVR